MYTTDTQPYEPSTIVSGHFSREQEAASNEQILDSGGGGVLWRIPFSTTHVGHYFSGTIRIVVTSAKKPCLGVSSAEVKRAR